MNAIPVRCPQCERRLFDVSADRAAHGTKARKDRGLFLNRKPVEASPRRPRLPRPWYLFLFLPLGW